MLLSKALRAVQKTNLPIYVGGKTAQFAGSTSSAGYTITLSGLTGGAASTPSQNDIIIVVYSTGSNDVRTTYIISSGYRYITRSLSDPDTYNSNLIAAVKISDGTEASVIVSPSLSSADAAAVAIHVWRNIDLDIIVEKIEEAVGSDTFRIDPPSITPYTSGAIIIAGGGSGHITPAVTYATPSELSNFIQISGVNDTYDTRVAIGSATWTSGAFDVPQFTTSGATDSNNNSYSAFSIALRPAFASNSSLYPSFINGQNSYETGSENTVSKPTNTTQNDLLVLFLALDNKGSNQFTAPTGFTERVSSTTTSYIYKVYTKVAGSSEPSTYTVSWLKDGIPDSADSSLLCINLRNATTTGAVYGTVSENAATTQPFSTGISITDNGILLFFYGTKAQVTFNGFNPKMALLGTSTENTGFSSAIFYRLQHDIDASTPTSTIYPRDGTSAVTYVTQQLFFPRS